MKHLILILGTLCLGSSSIAMNNHTLHFWQQLFPTAFSTNTSSARTTSATTMMCPAAQAADSLELIKLLGTTNVSTIDFTWDVSNPICNWGDVVLDSEGYVIEIEKGGLAIFGSLPPTFGATGLNRMKIFRIQDNQFMGMIPASLGNLDALEILWLDDNNFTGTIPDELSNASNLVDFWCDNNQLTGGIPNSFLLLNRLTNLQIFNNQLDFLPDFSGMTTDIFNSNNIQCQNNSFTFEDLAPNASYMNRPNNDFYSPQADFTIPPFANLTTGSTYAIDLGFDAGVADNVYTWTKDAASLVTIVGNNQLDLTPITFADAGVYCCTVTNPRLPLLTLSGNCQTISVTCGTSTGLIDDDVCAGGFITVNGNDYGDPAAGFPDTGTEDVPEPDQYGCDSIVEIDLTIVGSTPTPFEPVICPDDTVFVNGTPYYLGNDEGTEEFNVDGCDSTVNVNVDFFPEATNDIDGIYCRTDTIFVDGVAYYFGNANGDQTLFNRNFRGCDSIVSIRMDFYPAYEGTYDQQLCTGQSIFVNGKEYNESMRTGIEWIEGVAPNGCDSLITIDLSFGNGNSSTRADRICSGQSVFINGTEYGDNPLPQTGTELINLANGCQDTIFVDIRIEQPSRNLNPFLCFNDTLVVNGNTYGNPNQGYTRDGTEMIPGMNGCDTLVTIFLNFLSPEDRDTNFIICPGGGEFFNGKLFTTGNTPAMEFVENTNSTACDIRYTITVSERVAEEEDLFPEVCPNGAFELNNKIFDVDDPTGTVVLEDINGCDSLIIDVELSFYDSLKGTLNRRICEDDNFTYNGTLYGAGGIDNGMETRMGAGANGCDSFIQVNVLYYPNETGIDTFRLCPGQSIEFDNTLYGSQNGGVDSGTETLEGEGFMDCDSTVQITVVYYNLTAGLFQDRICQSDTIFYNGNPYYFGKDSGTENIGPLSYTGCDSMVNVQLSFHPPIRSEINSTLCEGTTIIVNGTEYGEAPDFPQSGQEIMQSFRLCDSIIDIDLSFNAFVENNINEDICGCEPRMINGQSYDCNNPTDTIIMIGASYVGCDSIININLNYVTPPETDLNTVLCAEEHIIVRGNRYDINTPMGTEVFPLDSDAGCDSTVNINLTFFTTEIPQLDTAATICQGDSIMVGNRTYFDEGIFSELLDNSTTNGCDSIIVLTLTVVAPEPIPLDNLGEICSSADPLDLPLIQLGISGNWSGDHVINNQFDPSLASGTINLLFTPTSGCVLENSAPITISSFSSNSVTDSLCPGQMVTIADKVYDTPGMYRDTLESMTTSGCDSLLLIEILERTLTPVSLEPIADLCADDDAIILNTIQSGIEGNWSGEGVDANLFDPMDLSGDILLSFTPTSNNNCATANTIMVSVNEPAPVDLEPLGQVCGNQSVAISTTTAGGISGVWSGPGINAMGNEFNPDGLSGTITLTFTPDGDPCLSSNTTTITIGSFAISNNEATLCNNETVIFNEVIYDTPGMYSDTIPQGSVAGCDSVLLITITREMQTVMLATFPGLCSSGNPIDLPTTPSGITGNWTGMNVSDNRFDPMGLNGSFTLEFTPDPGQCAIGASTNIEVGDNASGTLNAGICEGDSFDFGGVSLTIAGTYMDTTINGAAAGCDSITTLTLVVNTSEYTLENFAPICGNAAPITLATTQDGVMGTWEGMGVNSTNNTFNPNSLSGNIILTFNPMAGSCVEASTTEIMVNETITNTLTEMVCEGDSYTINGVAYDASGTFTETISGGAAGGCDSVIVLNLTIASVENLPAADAGTDQDICGDETNLSATLSAEITGRWTTTSDVLLDNSTDPSTVASGFLDETTQLIWIVSSETCADYDQDTVTVFTNTAAPIAMIDSFSLDETTPSLNLDILSNDDLSTDYTVTLLNEPLIGTLTEVGDGSYDFTAPAELTSNVQTVFDYEICSTSCPDLCSVASVIIQLAGNDKPVVEIPSGITPNGDGTNDFFVIPALRDRPQDFERAELVVFNRWGDVIFQAQPYRNEWDGSGPTGKTVPEGTYYYVLHLNLGKGITYKGEITILR